MYEKVTRGIRVSVRPEFRPDQSDPERNYFVWAYHVRIYNGSRHTVQLMTRHWRIVDARGHVQEVRGAGVVGEQPVLRPGESFEYTSGTPLQTESGFMAGSYQMQAEDGSLFEVAIPAFALDVPDTSRPLH
ncbi:Co2+/Mg2+ efflux protein ApaG [Thermopetrobacter sp. TC1]|uniref:Co2+/Mg2+ efflux protein ApaG n=1 Tax=Thermopetrobacter sp. TC1 TaxID=1495045 RepID=UPI00056FE21B|nr:Co2+/Mg2+ efflux protein ApaG [Thermopetrobacter sp. TC1]